MWIVALVCSTLIATAFADGCGNPAIKPDVNLNDRIVGGTVAVPHSWPWQGALYSKALGGLLCSQICGGSLISAEWFGSEDDPGSFSVKLGAHTKGYGCRANSAEPMQQVLDISEIHIHPLYDHDNNTWDISLLRLKTPATLTEYVSPICLPSQTDSIKDGENVVVTGWGTLTDGGLTLPQTLHEVVVPIVSFEECNTDYAGQIDDKTMICAGLKSGGKDSCQGDSGGPLAAYHENLWVMEGIVSWGDGCAEAGKPGVYARVHSFLDFITQTTGIPTK